MIVKIKRQADAKSPSYWQSFSYEGPRHVPVSAVLDALNYTDDLFDIHKKYTSQRNNFFTIQV